MGNPINQASLNIDPNLFAEYAAGIESQSKEVSQKLVKDIAEILAGAGVNVVAAAKGAPNAAKPNSMEPFAPVEMDEAEGAEEIKLTTEDTERIIALLQAVTSKEQLKQLKEKLANRKGQLAAKQQEQLKKIENSISEAKKAEAAAKRRRRWGIFGAIFAVAAAIFVTIATGGLAAGLAITGALVAVANVVLTETGVMEKWAEKLTEHYQKKHPEWSKAQCAAHAQGVIGGVMLGISVILLACSFFTGGATAGKGLIQLTENAKKVGNIIMGGVNAAGFVVNTGLTIDSVAANKRASDAAAEVTDFEKILLRLRKQLEENDEAIQEILEQLNNIYISIPELLESTTTTSNTILNNTVRLA